MLVRIANTLILGKPLVMYLGLLTLFVWLVAIGVMVLDRTKRSARQSIWHRRIVGIALILASAHMVLALSLFF